MIAFNENLAGSVWYASIDNLVVHTTVVAAAGETVTLSGWYDTDYFVSAAGQEYIKLFITEVSGAFITQLPDGSGPWIWKKNNSVSQYTSQNIIEKLIANNQYIFENNLLISRFSDRLTSTEKYQLYYLQARLDEREQMLREGSDVFSQMQEAQIAGYSNYQLYLSLFMSKYNPSVGLVITTTTAIVLSAVVIASLATAAYFAFKVAYEESVTDVELSKEMLTIFEKYKMTDEDIATIERETQGIVTKAVLMSKIKTTFGSLSNILLIAAGAVGFYYLLQWKDKK